MNAKEEVIKILESQIKSHQYSLNYECSVIDVCNQTVLELVNYIELLQHLITATEAAIFDVPSEEEISEAASECKYALYQSGFASGCKFILNYKKTESDDTERKSN